MNDFYMEIKVVGNDFLIVLKGELDAYYSIDFKKRMIEEVMGSKMKKIIFDMTNLSYIDSAGLGALVSVLKRANDSAKELRFFGMRNSVRKIFELTKLNMIFKIFDTYEEACV